MARLRQKKGRYYAEFYDPSQTPPRRWVPLGTTNQRDAQAVLRLKEKEYLRGRFNPWPRKEEDSPSVTVRDAIERFLTRYPNPTTRKNYAKVLASFTRRPAFPSTVDRITADDVASFLEGRSPVTQRNYHAHIRAFLRAFGSKAADGVRPPKQKGRRIPKAVWEDEYELLLKASEGWLRDFMRVMWESGMRPSEVCRLRWENVDWRWDLVWLGETKTDESETIPLYKSLKKILLEIGPKKDGYVFPSPIGGGPRSVSSVSHHFLAAKRAAGISRKVTLYGLRHGFGTRLALRGVNVKAIQDAYRHKDVSTTMIYLHAVKRHVREAVENS